MSHAQLRMYFGAVTDGIDKSVLVNVWNNAAFPNYKSRLWNTMPVEKKTGSSSAPPPRTSSLPKTTGSRTANLAPPVQRDSQKRSVSPVPGGWE